jgi:hypothetical protein
LGFNKDIIHFKLIVETIFATYPIVQYPKTHFSKIPASHHPNWGEAHNLRLDV